MDRAPRSPFRPALAAFAFAFASASIAPSPASSEPVATVAPSGSPSPVSASSPAAAPESPASASPPVVASGAGPAPAITARAERWMRLMQTGKPDRSELSPGMNAAVPDAIVQLVAGEYGPLGEPIAFTFVRRAHVRGGTAYVYRATFASQAVTWIFAIGDDGKVIGFHFYPPGDGR